MLAEKRKKMARVTYPHYQVRVPYRACMPCAVYVACMLSFVLPRPCVTYPHYQVKKPVTKHSCYASLSCYASCCLPCKISTQRTSVRREVTCI